MTQRVTVYRADGSKRDVAVGDQAAMDRFENHYRSDSPLRVVRQSDAELAAEHADYDAALTARRIAGTPDFGPAPLTGADWDRAWDTGPGSEG